MRCYHFGNYYLSSIQQGVQSAHAQMELFNKYQEIDLYEYSESTGLNPPEHIVRRANLAKMLFDWSKHHKTMICLNGGNNKDLLEIKDLLTQNDTYPWSYFCEDEDSLGSIITNVAIVLPEKIYSAAEKIRNKQAYFNENNLIIQIDEYDKEIQSEYTFTDFEVKLIQTLNKCQLAR